MAASSGKSKQSLKTENRGTKTSGKSRSRSKSRSIFNLRNATWVLCLLGISICVLSLYIEILKERDPGYVAICDISSYITCSKVLTSRYGKGFGLVDRVLSKDSIFNQPNPVYGLAFYLLQASLVLMPTAQIATIQVIVSILANSGSVYLGYILFFILQDFCVLCVSTYVINILMLIANIYSMKSYASHEIKMQTKKKK